MNGEGKWWRWVRRVAGLAALGYVLIANPSSLPPWVPVLIAALLFGPDVLDYQVAINRRKDRKDRE